MTEDERLDEKNAALAERIAAMEAAQAHDGGRPVYPVTAEEYTAQLDEGNEALALKLATMADEQAAQLAKYPPAPEQPAPIKVKKAKGGNG